MVENKTKPAVISVIDFLNTVEPENRRLEVLQLNQLFEEATGERGLIWGSSIIGYGSYHYKYESGREGDFMRVRFSPRKARLSLYIMGNHEKFKSIFAKLGKYKTGKSCVYVNKLEDINIDALRELIKASYDYIGKKIWP